MVFSKLMPLTGNTILDSIKNDSYYALLVPATLPVLVIFFFLNWLSLKFFRHN